MQDRQHEFEVHHKVGHAKAWLSAVLVAFLVVDVPLTCVLSLQAELHYLIRIRDHDRSVVVSKSHQRDTLPRSASFNLEPKALLQYGPRHPLKTFTALLAPFSLATPRAPKWVVVETAVPRDDRPTARLFSRVYDPLGPPILSL